MPTTPVNLSQLLTVHDHALMKGIPYGLGSKAPSLSCDTSQIRRIDCSGYIRFLLAKATNQQMIIPDGSWNQRDWCERNGLARKNYPDLHYADQSRLFIAFITPGVNNAGSVGHVWLVNQMDDTWPSETMESYGGHGVGSRRWDTGVLRRECAVCFELPVAK